jgi:DNA-binding response OmpR family regulator
MAKRIYVLEDDKDISEIVQMVLEMEGHQVTCFADVSKFNAGKADGVPDLYLLDIMLPDGNGLEVRAALGNDPATAHIPVLIMSAHTNVAEVSNWPGEKHFIAKPFDIYKLTEKIASLLKG